MFTKGAKVSEPQGWELGTSFGGFFYFLNILNEQIHNVCVLPGLQKT